MSLPRRRPGNGAVEAEATGGGGARGVAVVAPYDVDEDGHELDRLVASRVDVATEAPEAARDGDALAALVFSGRVLGGGHSCRRSAFQLLAVRRRAAREHGVDLGAVWACSANAPDRGVCGAMHHVCAVADWLWGSPAVKAV